MPMNRSRCVWKGTKREMHSLKRQSRHKMETYSGAKSMLATSVSYEGCEVFPDATRSLNVEAKFSRKQN